MLFVDVLKECENAGGDGSKKVIQAALAKLDADGRKLLRYTMDPYKQFYVKKYDEPAIYADPALEPTDHTPFFEALDKLSSREVTGNAARALVILALSAYSKDTAQYLARVIDKDPKGGFSADTANLVFLSKDLGMDFDTLKKDIKKNGIERYRELPAYKELIPSWDEQLAEKLESEEEFEQYVTFPCQADVKYDGNRAFAFVKAGEPVDYRARGGKESTHLLGVFDAELQLMREQFGQDFVLDGEVLAASFTETQNAKKGGSDKSALVFRAFFIMPLADWIAKKTTVTNRTARDTIRNLTQDLKRVIPSQGKMVNSYKEMTEYCNEVIDDETKPKAEREGLILKDLDAVYHWGRSVAWIKVKRFYDVDARFVSFYAARKGTRLAKAGLIGGANCVAFLENGERVEFNVGSGFSDAQRRDMAENPDKWLKATHVIKYQEVSIAKGKTVKSLRFCTLSQAFRDDKLVEI